MKTFIFLIVLCTIFNVNQSQPTDNHGSKTDTPREDINEVTKIPSHCPPELSNKNHNAKVSNFKTDETTKRLPDKSKQQKVPGLSESVGKTDVITERLLTETKEHKIPGPSESIRKRDLTNKLPTETKQHKLPGLSESFGKTDVTTERLLTETKQHKVPRLSESIEKRDITNKLPIETKQHKLPELSKSIVKRDLTNKLPTETKQHKIPGLSERVGKRDLTNRLPRDTENHEIPKPSGNVGNNSMEMPSQSTAPMFSPANLPYVKENNSDRDSITLPNYAMGIIMFAMALMFFIIMALLFMLYKIKKDNRRRDSMNVSIQPKNERNHIYSRHLSDEGSNVSTLLKDKTKDSKLVLTRSDSKALFINNLDAIDSSKEKSPFNDLKTSRINIPESNPSTPKIRQPTLTRILKQPSINHVPITREQMSELCEGVLSKKKRSNETTSLSDIEKLLNECKNEEKDKTDMEKCLSTPELDTDMYDVLPTPSPRKFFENDDDIKIDEYDDEVYDSPPKHKINDSLKKHENKESDDEVYDNPVPHQHDNEVFDDGIYDNPPPNNNRKRNVVVSTDHEEYVMPLTNDNGLYGNAKHFVDNKICKN